GLRVIAGRKRAVRARIRDVRSRTRPYVRKKGVSWLILCTSKEVTRGLQPRKLCITGTTKTTQGSQRAKPQSPPRLTASPPSSHDPQDQSNHPPPLEQSPHTPRYPKYSH